MKSLVFSTGVFALVTSGCSTLGMVNSFFADIVPKIKANTQAQVPYLEGYPKVQGTPWLDSGEKIGSNN